MKHTRPFINTLATLFFLTIFASLVHAQSTAQRTFVSTSGNDANTASLCSAQNPCRSFTSALTVTTAGGEIVPLTSGGYGAVTITKSVQIIAPFGVYAAITAPSGNGITVSAGANDTVVLKGLTINGLGTGGRGISFTSGKTLHVESCTITGFTGVGALYVSTDANNTRVFIKDTIVRNNTDSGVFFRNNTGLLYVSIDRTRAEGNTQNGFVATTGRG